MRSAGGECRVNYTRGNFTSIFGSDGPLVMQMYGIDEHFDCNDPYSSETTGAYSFMKSPVEAAPVSYVPTQTVPTQTVPTQTAYIYSGPVETIPTVSTLPTVEDSTPIVVYVPNEVSLVPSEVSIPSKLSNDVSEDSTDVFELSRQSAIADELRRTQRELELYKQHLRELEIVMAESLSAKTENNLFDPSLVYTVVSADTMDNIADTTDNIADTTDTTSIVAVDPDPELTNECPVCFEREVGKTLIPCGHCFCVQCDTGDNCPICRVVISHTHVIFL